METLLNFLGAHLAMIYFVVLAIFVGVEVIGGVPTVLHTPLMSGANAIHGVVVLGAIHVMLHADPADTAALALGTLVVLLGTLNVVGGFVVTDRMLEMLKRRNERSPGHDTPSA
jgi:NAD(P) transhydrogenase subunit alpha